MNNERLEQASVSAAASLRDTMVRLNASGMGIALVVDEQQRLLGTVTDGDLRRALLAGASLDAQVIPFVQTKFTSVLPNASRIQVLELMQALGLGEIPVVDQAGRLEGLHLLRELLGRVVRPNAAVILAGGKGTRLFPLTSTMPKPMLKVAGRPIIERLILHLVGFGVQNIFISVNYLAHVIEDHFGDGARFGCRIRYLREEEPLGTGGPLALLPEPPTAPLLVMNGDLVTDFDIDGLLNFHRAGEYAATLSVRPYLHQVPFGCLHVQDNCVLRLEEKPTILQTINAGIYVLEPFLLERIPREAFAITRLFEQCLERGEKLGSYPLTSEWIDVGMADQLRQAREGKS
jgi:dTDP-glucose pyrophosphorylase